MTLSITKFTPPLAFAGEMVLKTAKKAAAAHASHCQMGARVRMLFLRWFMIKIPLKLMKRFSTAIAKWLDAPFQTTTILLSRKQSDTPVSSCSSVEDVGRLRSGTPFAENILLICV
ncbi:MAG: hypothetical protein ABIQ90_11430 [Polaromonas sp.]